VFDPRGGQLYSCQKHYEQSFDHLYSFYFRIDKSIVKEVDDIKNTLI